MKVFTLYIGTGHTKAKQTLLEILRKYFESFTVISGEGYFRGEAEPMWFVKVATENYSEIFAAANTVRLALKQDVIGIEHQGQYYKCSAEDDASVLKEVLKNDSSNGG